MPQRRSTTCAIPVALQALAIWSLCLTRGFLFLVPAGTLSDSMARSIEIVSPLAATGRLGESTKAQVILNNRCQLRCEWCWGPEHDKPESGRPQDWQQLIGNLAVAESMPYIAPVDRITVSGGEPLLSQLLIPVLKTAREHRMRTKLSTNGIFLKRLVEVLPLCDELAVGIDGNSE